jgi:uncharacterized protein
MKHEVRDNDVELFCGSEPKHVALLEINPVRKAKNPRVLFRLVEAGPFEAGVLERVNPSYPRVPVELCTDSNHVTLVGHSEGTTIVPRVAINNPNIVDKIVLLAPVAQNWTEIGDFQGVRLPVLYARQVLDRNHNGLLSVQEASKNPVFSSLVGNLTLVLAQNITTANGTAERLNPKYNINNDTFISINDELTQTNRPTKISVSCKKRGKCNATHDPCPIWVTSLYSSTPNLDIISKVPSTTSILIMHGQNDSQNPIQQASLLQQRLTEVRHPDHTLLTYPNLGHSFYPSSEWQTGIGPIEQRVLEDLFGWLSDPVIDFKEFTILRQE